MSYAYVPTDYDSIQWDLVRLTDEYTSKGWEFSGCFELSASELTCSVAKIFIDYGVVTIKWLSVHELDAVEVRETPSYWEAPTWPQVSVDFNAGYIRVEDRCGTEYVPIPPQLYDAEGESLEVRYWTTIPN